MMNFEIEPEYKPLIHAAIGLGDWLANRPEATPDQVEAIRALQAALRRLPEPTPGLDAEYGFLAHPAQHDAPGVWRVWSVGMDDMEGLTLDSCYTPYPEVSIHEQTDHELMFELKPGQPHHADLYYAAEWIAEVGSPEVFLVEGIHWEIEARRYSVTPE